MSQIAITRGVSAAIVHCELTHLSRQPIDLAVARAQHRRYEEVLGELGCTVLSLPADPDLPDSVFVEDTAVVFDELALIARSGAPARRGEAAALARALAPYRRLVRLDAPGTLDGGDVLRAGRQVYVGASTRTDPAGMRQLEAILRPFGYRVSSVPVHGCLHLKSAVTAVAPDLLLLNPRWVDPGRFAGYRILEVAPGEPYAANGLRVGGRLVYPSAFPETAGRLEAAGVALVLVEMSELHKAEGAVTCCSVVFETAN